MWGAAVPYAGREGKAAPPPVYRVEVGVWCVRSDLLCVLWSSGLAERDGSADGEAVTVEDAVCKLLCIGGAGVVGRGACRDIGWWEATSSDWQTQHSASVMNGVCCG